MPEFFFRTEDIRSENIQELYVGSDIDREIIDSLKSSQSVILEGSRGTGKSFLLRMAEVELDKDFTNAKILPVNISFVASSLIHTSDPEQFKNWMLALICNRLIRAFRKKGFFLMQSQATSLLCGNTTTDSIDNNEERFQRISKSYEESYKNVNLPISIVDLPDVISLKDAVEELCQENNISRICLLFDEAIHIFRQEQQRQFFTLFRDLRSPYINCNAAVYPGVTSYGNTFEMSHDATYLRIERDILEEGYVNRMKGIVLKQANESLITTLNQYGENFSVLAYAASGNPRMLLKTVDRCPRMRINDVNQVIKDYYRTDIWTEHTGLGIKYSGHRSLVDWGREFVEKDVLIATRQKNEIRADFQESTCYFWVHRDAPEPVKESLRMLEYTEIIRKHSESVRATNSHFGTRYELKLVGVLSLEATPTAIGLDLIKKLTIKRMTEYGMNSPRFSAIENIKIEEQTDEELRTILLAQLDRSIDVLDLSQWQKNTLKQNGYNAIRSILESSELDMQNIRYIGKVRSRQIRNATLAELLEYLSG